MSTTFQQQELPLEDQLSPYPVRRWTLEEYHALIDQGVFEDERVELLEGWIVPKMTRNPPHDTTLTFVEECLRPLLRSEFYLRLQQAVTFENSEPEPDLAVVNGSARDYRKRHPGGNDIQLIVEVADASLRKDRQKASIYAAAGVPVYWIVNLAEQLVEVFTDPNVEAKAYRQVTNFEIGKNLPVSLGKHETTVEVTEIFPQD